mmetsp:Transcript_1428/g.3919  ORF Transcript_1428/g.3919 Transcript_1428/m.3919 type:complete len:343 (-) Transcript_1428:372-1400(-)
MAELPPEHPESWKRRLKESRLRADELRGLRPSFLSPSQQHPTSAAENGDNDNDDDPLKAISYQHRGFIRRRNPIQEEPLSPKPPPRESSRSTTRHLIASPIHSGFIHRDIDYHNSTSPDHPDPCQSPNPAASPVSRPRRQFIDPVDHYQVNHYPSPHTHHHRHHHHDPPPRGDMYYSSELRRHYYCEGYDDYDHGGRPQTLLPQTAPAPPPSPPRHSSMGPPRSHYHLQHQQPHHHHQQQHEQYSHHHQDGYRDFSHRVHSFPDCDYHDDRRLRESTIPKTKSEGSRPSTKTPMVEISPGVQIKLRGAAETKECILRDFITECKCFSWYVRLNANVNDHGQL